MKPQPTDQAALLLYYFQRISYEDRAALVRTAAAMYHLTPGVEDRKNAPDPIRDTHATH